MEDPALNGTTLQDPTLMDTNMDTNIEPNIDDLFGEAGDGLTADNLGIALPSSPLSPGVVLHISDMQRRGCCT